jgi:hypothetical protein
MQKKLLERYRIGEIIIIKNNKKEKRHITGLYMLRVVGERRSSLVPFHYNSFTDHTL